LDLLERIVTDPEIIAGKPVVKGTRIPVETVLAHLVVTPDIEDLLQAYPRLTMDDVKACFAYVEAQLRKSYKRSQGALTRNATR
jgi:uncharacterized protein (DUF433 family)